MRDAERLRTAEARAADSDKAAQESRTLRDSALLRLEKEQTAGERRREESHALLVRFTAITQAAAEYAAAVNLAGEHERVQAALLPYERLGERTREDVEKSLPALRAGIQRRREQMAQIHARLRALAEAATARNNALATRTAYLAQLEAARARANDADAHVKQRADDHLHHWRHFLDELTGLAIEDADAAVDALGMWVESLAGDHPLQSALLCAHQQAIARLAAEEAAAEHERRLIGDERAALDLERESLLAGAHPVPPAPYTRAPDVRLERPGAPLWQLLDFRDHVPDAERAGLEAALEAAGLLDAWVTPEGVALDAKTHDVLLVPRTAVAHSLDGWLRPTADGLAVTPAAVDALIAGISCGAEDSGSAETWVSPNGQFRAGSARGAWMKPSAQYIGYAARERARHERVEAIEEHLAQLDTRLSGIDAALAEILRRRDHTDAEYARAPSDGALRDAHARFGIAESQRREAHDRYAEADARFSEAERAWMQARDVLVRDAEDLKLPHDAAALMQFDRALSDYADHAHDLVQGALECRRALADALRQEQHEREARIDADYWNAEHARRVLTAEEAAARRDTLRDSVGAAVHEIEQRLAAAQAAVSDGEAQEKAHQERYNKAVESRGASGQRAEDAQQVLDERQERRQEAIEKLQGYSRTGLLSVAVAQLDTPDMSAPWTIDPALQLARRIEQVLADVPAEDPDWTRIQSTVSNDFNQLVQAMAAQGHQAQSEQTDYGLVVHIVYLNRPERPDLLERRLEAEITERREILTAREREVLENYLQSEVATSLQRLLKEAEHRVRTINAELARRPTSTGVRFRLDWEALPEGEDGAPIGLAATRSRLLQRAPDAWSPEDRRAIGDFLHQRIHMERGRDEGTSLLEHLTRTLDYRRWHRFRIKRLQEGTWRPLSGPASSGERALGLTVPLFAAASSHYASGDYPHAPRLVLLDEAYAGIDDEARAHCMALIREFDLDFVMTSEREWGCYAELPGLAICQLVRREGVDAVYVSRWSWDGHARREALDPSRRFPEAAAAT